MNHRGKFLAVLASVLTVAACADTEPTGRLTGPEFEASASSREMEAAGQYVARAFAMALSEPELRAQVRNAMRASLFGEHKLVLQEFLATESGRRFLAAAAEHPGVEADLLRKAVAQLPPMDFYAPFREHRRSWRATSDVVFVVTLDQNAPEVTGYTAKGRVKTYKLADGIPSEPMLMLHPSEEKFRRVNPQSNAPGAVIEDLSDGTISGKYEYRGADGLWKSIELADLPREVVREMQCPPQGCSASTLSASYSTTSTSEATSTWMNNARIKFNTEWGDEEVRWTARGYDSGLYRGDGRIFHNANPSSWYAVNQVWLSDFAFNGWSRWIDTDVYEIDPMFDDYQGSATNYNCLNTGQSCTHLVYGSNAEATVSTS